MSDDDKKTNPVLRAIRENNSTNDISNSFPVTSAHSLGT
jgi:hypothetical protein